MVDGEYKNARQWAMMRNNKFICLTLWPNSHKQSIQRMAQSMKIGWHQPKVNKLANLCCANFGMKIKITNKWMNGILAFG